MDDDFYVLVSNDLKAYDIICKDMKELAKYLDKGEISLQDALAGEDVPLFGNIFHVSVEKGI